MTPDPALPPRLSVAQEGERCDKHEWETVRAGGHPAEATSAERVTYCRNCGAEPSGEPATPPPALPTLETELTTARLAVNDWHACGTADELDQWRKAQHRLIDAAKAVGRTADHAALLALVTGFEVELKRIAKINSDEGRERYIPELTAFIWLKGLRAELEKRS